MTVALTRGKVRDPKSGILSRPSLQLALAVAVVPNIVFLLASPWYIVARPIAALSYLLAGIVALFALWWVACGVFVFAGLCDLMLIVMFAFHLPIDVALNSLKYMSSIDVTGSLLYIAIVTTVVLTSTCAAWMVNRSRNELRSASLVPAILVAFGVTWGDWTFTYPYFDKPELPFDSAMARANLTGDSIVKQRKNLFIVMVEGLGAFSEPEQRDLFQSRLASNLKSDRFSLKSGTSSYIGSTTGATSRELCGKWGDYLTYLGKGKHDCLPRRLAENGYETIAYHGRSYTMFERDRWYPAIGFQNLYFYDRLVKEYGARLTGRCGTVFDGLCDRQIAGVVKDELLKADAAPKLVYWLTLNSHIPYTPLPEGTMNCGAPHSAISNKTVCELSEIWLSVFDEINKIAKSPSLPPTDILVVGDHHTPLWERRAKDMFTLHKVDWYLLQDQRQADSRASN